MSVFLEFKKAKRTGLLPTYIAGGMLAAAVPVVNMAVRSEMYLTRQGNPVSILFHANWQMMAMLNILLVTSGTCLLYHIAPAIGWKSEKISGWNYAKASGMHLGCCCPV